MVQRANSTRFLVVFAAMIALFGSTVARVCKGPPQGWCTHSGARFSRNLDCDGDGIADSVCIDTRGNYGYQMSRYGCKDTWPRGNRRACKPIIPTSKCRLNTSITNITTKAGMNLANIPIATTISPRANVADTSRQCPGDKFYFSCSPRVSWIRFDTRYGRINVSVPKTQYTSMRVSCTFSKVARNG